MAIEATTAVETLRIGTHSLSSRLIVGTGKYATYDLMREALDLSGCDCLTVAVRRDRLVNARGENILEFIDTTKYTLLPNTAGCFSAEDAVRVAKLGREILLGLENPGADWVKARSAGRYQDTLARSRCHAASDRATCGGGLSGALLHDR